MIYKDTKVKIPFFGKTEIFMINNWKKLQEDIGYSFKDASLMIKAMSHSSYSNENGQTHADCNERLEFLGDAVLELVSSEFLYEKYDKVSEGELTKLRANLVCETALDFDARSIGLNNYLLLGRGEELTGGRERPSIISDACEALIGAIYLDGGIEKAREFILKFVLNDEKNKRMLSDSKTALQELVQGEMGKTPTYEIIGESGPEHSKTFVARVSIDGEVLGQGKGKTKKNAEQQASYNALLKLKGGR